METFSLNHGVGRKKIPRGGEEEEKGNERRENKFSSFKPLSLSRASRRDLLFAGAFRNFREILRPASSSAHTRQPATLRSGQVTGSLDTHLKCKDVVQLVERRTGTPPTQVRFPDAARDFSLVANFQGRLSYGACVRTPLCAIACIYICAHVKNPEIHVRVRWIMQALKHPACIVGWVTRLCRGWLSPGKATQISRGSNPIGTIQL